VLPQDEQGVLGSCGLFGTLTHAESMGMGHTHTGQMASLVVLGVFTQEAISLCVEQWLITCPLAATKLGGNSLLVLRSTLCSQGEWQTGLRLTCCTR